MEISDYKHCIYLQTKPTVKPQIYLPLLQPLMAVCLGQFWFVLGVSGKIYKG